MALPLFDNLKSLNIGVLCQYRSPESVKLLRHKDSSDADTVTRCTLPCVLTLCSDLDGAGNVTDRDLITRLLEFDVLKANEFRASDRHHELALDLVGLALVSGALKQRVVLLLPNHLVHFEPAHITNVDRHLHLWLDVACPHNDTLDCDERANRLSFDVSHSPHRLFGELSRHDVDLIRAF
jgi:hypothetical protein